MRVRRVALLGAALTLCLSSAAHATPSGPRYSVQLASMQAALTCSGDLTKGATPVLFIHGTTSNAKANWSWNWNREFARRGWAFCNVDLPSSATGDVQISAEYVTFAIRTMHERAGRRISIVGHSQGGMIGRWSLKYWPDTRGMVDDYVGLASSNHGTQVFSGQCSLPIGCPAANWQQSLNSNFLTALNSGRETWPEVDYTVITTSLDEVVVPSTSGWLAPASNVTNTTAQSLCPLELVEHLGMAYDNAAWLVGLDALTHDGPATLSRVPRRCGNPFMPGVNPATAPTDLAAAVLQTTRALAVAKNLPAEPPLRDYAR